MGSIYCYYGPETGRRSEKIQNVAATLRTRHGDGLEILKFYITEDEVENIISGLSNGALFASHSLAIINNAELITKKRDLDALSTFAGRQGKDTTLIFVSDQTKLNAKLTNLASSQTREIFWELFENQRSGWVQQYLRKQGGSIDPQALELFLSLVPNNTQEMKQELDKILLLIQEKSDGDWRIREETVVNYIYHSREESVYSLFDAYARENFERALDILIKLCSAKNNEETAIVMRIVYLLRNLASLGAIRDERKIEDMDYNAVNIRGKRNRAVYQQLLNRLDTARIRFHVLLTAETEMELRLQKSTLHPHIIRMWLYKLFYAQPVHFDNANQARREIFNPRRHSFV